MPALQPVYPRPRPLARARVSLPAWPEPSWRHPAAAPTPSAGLRGGGGCPHLQAHTAATKGGGGGWAGRSGRLTPAPLPRSRSPTADVLLVDDEKISRLVVSKLLKKCNYKVTVAEGGEDALELLQDLSHNFHIVVTDVMMPGIDGMGLLKAMTQNQRLAHIPVVMMSSQEEAGTVFEAIRAGAEDYILKPLTMKEVVHLWQHVWRRRTTVRKAGVLRGEKTPSAEGAVRAGANAAEADTTGTASEPPTDDEEEEGAYTAEEMREHCLRQINRYQRVLEILDAYPHLFPQNEAEARGVGKDADTAEEEGANGEPEAPASSKEANGVAET